VQLLGSMIMVMVVFGQDVVDGERSVYAVE
jgi:hypothetical protein